MCPAAGLCRIRACASTRGRFPCRTRSRRHRHPGVPSRATSTTSDCVPVFPSTNSGATCVFAAGRVVSWENSRYDIMFAHPFGTGDSFDIELDAPYRELLIHPEVFSESDPSGGHEATRPETDRVCTRRLHASTVCVHTLHLELESGLKPWTPGGPWYIPQENDRVAAMGYYVIDCGHPANYQSEIHPPAFLAFAQNQRGGLSNQADRQDGCPHVRSVPRNTALFGETWRIHWRIQPGFKMLTLNRFRSIFTMRLWLLALGRGSKPTP